MNLNRIILGCVSVVAFGGFAVAQTVTSAVIAAPPAVIDTGTYAGQALVWVMATFGTAVGSALTAWLVRLLKQAGAKNADLVSAKLNEIIVNGLNLAAKEVAADSAGKGQVAVKNAVVARAVQYAQEHGADTLKKLGEDPASQKAIEAINARIETAIADPAQPTPAVLDAPGAEPKAAPLTANVTVK